MVREEGAGRALLESMIQEDPHRLRRRSLARGVPRDDADDVAQTVLLRAWRSIEHLEEPTPGRLCSWLDTIARNEAIDLARRRRRRPTVALDDAVADEHDAQDETEMRIILDGALEAIRSLPPALRDALVMSVADGLSTHEIGDRLGLTPEAVRQRIRRARKALAACRKAGMSSE